MTIHPLIVLGICNGLLLASLGLFATKNPFRFGIALVCLFTIEVLMMK